MSRSRLIPGARFLLYLTAAIGLVRTSRDLAAESGAPEEPIDPSTRAEPQDINATAVLLVGIGILLGIWALVVVLYPLFTYFKYERTGGKTPEKVLMYIPKLPPEPRNESNPRVDLEHFRTRQNAALNRYQWVDRGKGIVSIPIGRAIEVLSQRGIPPNKPGGSEYYPPSAGSRLTGFEGKVEPIPR